MGTFLNKFGTFVLQFLTLYLTRRGFTLTDAGIAMSAYGLGSLIASGLGGWLADVIWRRKTIVLSVFSTRTVQTGTHRNALGGAAGVIKDYGTETFESGRIKIELVSDVVTGLADVPLPPPPPARGHAR